MKNSRPQDEAGHGCVLEGIKNVIRSAGRMAVPAGASGCYEVASTAVTAPVVSSTVTLTLAPAAKPSTLMVSGMT